MAYEAYAGLEDYETLFPEGTEVSAEALRTASRHVDSLTFGRIRAAGGLGALTAFQREAVIEAVCRLAAFETEAGPALTSGLSAYSINGVSMRFGENAGLRERGGITAPGDVIALLEQTGLLVRTI